MITNKRFILDKIIRTTKLATFLTSSCYLICIFLGFFFPCATDVSTPVSAPETPNQLATDRATLAQEEEDSVQQQDNDDIGMFKYF